MSQDWDQVQGPTSVAQQLLDQASDDANKTNPALRRVPRAQVKRPRVIVLFGAPGSGKTTQGKLLASKRKQSVHFSTGDFFRQQVVDETDLGREVSQFLDADMFVPDALVLRVLNDFMEANPNKEIILDGVPRTLCQAKLLDDMCNVTRFVYLHISQQECKDRIAKRANDECKGRGDHDECKGRGDHDAAQTQRRMSTFYSTCGPILDLFRNKLAVALANDDAEIVEANIENALDQITRLEPSICACKLRLANQLTLPCGHCTQCATCVQQSSRCSTCNDEVQSLLVLGGGDAQEHKVNLFLTSSTVAKPRDQSLEDEGQVTTKRAKVCFTVHVPEVQTRKGQHIIAVVDVSGSMGATKAQQENEHGQLVDLPYTLLDAVKYSLKAIIKCMIETDHFTLVTFSSMINTLMECEPMNAANTERALALIDSMRATGGTDLWAGLERALEITQRHAPMQVTIALLTDGVPDKGRDGVSNLRKWQSMSGREPFELVTFGYGSELQLNVLFELAELGHGNYIWIPSSSETGSIFVKFMANASAICAQNVTLTVQASNKCMIASDPHGFPIQDIRRTPQACSVTLGSLRSGNTTEVVLDMLIVDEHYADVTLWVGTQVVASLKATNRRSSNDAGAACARLMMCNQLRKAILDPTDASYYIGEAIASLETMASTYPIVAFYLKDLKGEQVQLEDGSVITDGGKIAKGAVLAKFTSWGCHLLPSCLTTHQRKLCTNMYEVGCMPYNTPWTIAFTNMGKTYYEGFAPTIANVAQAPKPTVTYHYTPPAAAYVSSGFSDGGGRGSCLAGDCLTRVRTSNNRIEPRRIDELRVGDWVRGETTFVQIKYILKKTAPTALYDFPKCGLRISERHPFREPGQTTWRRAELEFQDTTSFENVVYNFVMWSGHVILVNDMACLCLGHDFDDTAIAHPLYASSSAMERACKTLTADADGTFTIRALKRDQQGRVSGFLQ